MFLLLLLGPVVLQAWAWRSLRGRVLSGAITRPAALIRYGGWALTPPLLFVGFMLGLIGVEEVLGTPIISEELGRVTLPVSALLLGSGLLGWLGFSIVCVLQWRAPGAKV